MNATTKLTLQQKFDISINVTDIKVSSQTNQGTISAYGTEKNCQEFYKYIDSQYKGLEVEVPASLMGRIYGKNGETLQLLKVLFLSVKKTCKFLKLYQKNSIDKGVT